MKKRLISLRKALGMTQAQFAAGIGMYRNAVVSYELGEIPTPLVIEAICRRYCVRREWLENGTGDMFEKDIEGRRDLAEAMFCPWRIEKYANGNLPLLEQELFALCMGEDCPCFRREGDAARCYRELMSFPLNQAARDQDSHSRRKEKNGTKHR